MIDCPAQAHCCLCVPVMKIRGNLVLCGKPDRTMKNTFQTFAIVTSILLSILFPSRQASCQQVSISLNDKEYFETRGFNVLAFENAYTGFFFDEKTSGIMLIHHGVRTATGGAVRLKPTPEQWDQR
jgi:endoglucanase